MEHVINERLTSRKISSVIQLGDSVWPDLQKACNAQFTSFHYQHFESTLPQARFDLGVIFDGIEKLEKQKATELIGTLKNQYCETLWVGMPANDSWSREDFIALGFKQSAQNPIGPHFFFYDFDIATYNRKRSWNNPKNWANPENWQRFRW